METSSTILFNRKGKTMKAKFRIYFDDLSAYVYSGTDLYIEFRDCEDIEHSATNIFDNMSIDIQSGIKQVDQWFNAGGGQSYTSDFESLSENGSYIEFVANLNNFSSFESFVSAGIVEIYPLANETLLYLYTQNSENNALNKSLTLVNIINGKFNHSIGVKSLNIDVVNIDMNFNYVYIPSLNRYYFVDSIEIISNDVRRLHLKEDVLMSWKTLIKRQSAFILRSQTLDNRLLLKDDRLPLEDKVSHQYFKNLTMGNLKNITFDYSTAGYRFMCMSFTTASEFIAILSNIVAPSNSGLPDIMPTLNYQTCMTFFPYYTLYNLIKGIYADSSKASFIETLMWLPFDPLSVFNVLTEQASKIYVGDKVLDTQGNWVNPATTGGLSPCRVSQTMGSPYLIVADFTFNQAGGIDVLDTMLMRGSYWEIYVAFVGWVNIDFTKVYGKRILIYYTIDVKTGISTAYIYNYTDKIVIYSTTCTLGIQVDFTSSNALENAKQKQANDLNMIISTLSNTISLGVGVATENPVAMVGAVMNETKAITNYVNSNNMLIERAQMNFGTSNGALYSPLDVCVRRSYHTPLAIDYLTYAHMQGYPCNKYDALSYYTGYVEIGEIHFNPFNEVIYQDEINEIVTLLKDGVIF